MRAGRERASSTHSYIHSSFDAQAAQAASTRRHAQALRRQWRCAQPPMQCSTIVTPHAISLERGADWCGLHSSTAARHMMILYEYVRVHIRAVLAGLELRPAAACCGLLRQAAACEHMASSLLAPATSFSPPIQTCNDLQRHATTCNDLQRHVATGIRHAPACPQPDGRSSVSGHCLTLCDKNPNVLVETVQPADWKKED